MFKRLFMVVSIVVMVSLLSGCQQHLEDALGIISQLLDDSSDEAGSGEQDETEDEVDNTEDEDDGDTDENSDVAGDAADDADGQFVAMTVPQFTATPELVLYDKEKAEPFDDRLRDQGYTIYKNPMGMPLRIPYQWVLVEGESEQDKFTGLYCFDMPIDTDQFVNFDFYHMGQNIQHNSNPDNDNVIHETRFDVGEQGKAIVQYGLDEYANTCAHVEINYETGSDIAIGPVEELTPVDVARERKLPDNYDEVFAKATSLDNFHTPDGRNSVKDAMYADESLSLPLHKEGLPEIFLYDSYMFHEVDNSGSSEINILMCTDIFPHIATDKHLELLSNYNANIDNFEVIPKEDNTSMLKAATIIDFSFNDEFGTGSWSGSSYFYRYENDDTPFSEQSCMATDMTFSTDIIQ